MKIEEVFSKLKKFWYWVWNSDSLASWIVAILFIYIFVKFIFFPILSLIMGTPLPLAGVESSSMDHQIVRGPAGIYNLCGKTFFEEEIKHINFDEYWDICGEWYEEHGISKEQFKRFPLRNGFKKGDIVVVWGRSKPKVGDVIVFRANPESNAPRPIVHRVVNITDEIYQTKGDHNKEQLRIGNNPYNTDETRIKKEQILGKVIFKIPYIAWIKIIPIEIIKSIRRFLGI